MCTANYGVCWTPPPLLLENPTSRISSPHPPRPLGRTLEEPFVQHKLDCDSGIPAFPVLPEPPRFSVGCPSSGNRLPFHGIPCGVPSLRTYSLPITLPFSFCLGISLSQPTLGTVLLSWKYPDLTSPFVSRTLFIPLRRVPSLTRPSVLFLLRLYGWFVVL